MCVSWSPSAADLDAGNLLAVGELHHQLARHLARDLDALRVLRDRATRRRTPCRPAHRASPPPCRSSRHPFCDCCDICSTRPTARRASMTHCASAMLEMASEPRAYWRLRNVLIVSPYLLNPPPPRPANPPPPRPSNPPPPRIDSNCCCRAPPVMRAERSCSSWEDPSKLVRDACALCVPVVRACDAWPDAGRVGRLVDRIPRAVVVLLPAAVGLLVDVAVGARIDVAARRLHGAGAVASGARHPRALRTRRRVE